MTDLHCMARRCYLFGWPDGAFQRDDGDRRSYLDIQGRRIYRFCSVGRRKGGVDWDDEDDTPTVA